MLRGVNRITVLGRALKMLLVVGMIAVIATVVFLVNSRGEGVNWLTEAVEGGESAMNAISRSHESLASFVEDEASAASELLKTARSSQENAAVKLSTSTRTKDIVVLEMINNYFMLLNSSYVMTQGVDNLLTVSSDLEKAFEYFGRGAYKDAADKANVCLTVLKPLVDQFDSWEQKLANLDYFRLASGQRDRVRTAVSQYSDEANIYRQYVKMLETIANSTDYLNAMRNVNDLFNQLQHAIANKDYATAQSLMQQISNQLQSLKDPRFQNMADLASQLNPNILQGSAYNTAQDLKNMLKDLQGLQGFENYLQSLDKYMEALQNYNQGNLDAALNSIGQGLSLLGQGQNLDPSLQQYYTSLQNAFGSLQMLISGQPDQG